MTQFTNVKYMEPSLDTKPNFDTRNTNSLELPTIPNSGISQSQDSKLIDTPRINQQPLASKPLFNKQDQKGTVKKEYFLPIIYKKLFTYFGNVFSTNKPEHKDISNMSDTELRVYVDQLLIRNQELKSYAAILQKWQNKFTRNVPVAHNKPKQNFIGGLNKPVGNSLLNAANKPGMLNKPTINSLRQPMNPMNNKLGLNRMSPMNKPGSMANRPANMMNRPGSMQNRPANMMNRPANMINKPMSKPIAMKSAPTPANTSSEPVMQTKPINK